MSSRRYPTRATTTPASTGGATRRSRTSHGRIGPPPTRSGRSPSSSRTATPETRASSARRAASRTSRDRARPTVRARATAAAGTATTSEGATTDSRAWVRSAPASVRARVRPTHAAYPANGATTASGATQGLRRSQPGGARRVRAASSASPTPRVHATSPTTCGHRPREPARSTAPSPQGADVRAAGNSEVAPRKARVAAANGRSQNATLPAATVSNATATTGRFSRTASRTG